MDASVEQFLTELAVQRRASAHTLRAYRGDLERLTTLAAGADVAQLKTPQLRRGLMQLHAQELAPRSIARTLSAWRSYYAWLARRGTIALNPADGLRAPKRPRSLPKALGIDQAAALLDGNGASEEASAAAGPLLTRDAAMFELFYSSGLRLSELVSLDWPGGLDLASGEVTITGKRQKTRTVPVGDKALSALQAWLDERPALVREGQPALFLGRNGTRLTPRQVAKRLAQWAQRQGVGVHVHPHMLRHSFASHVLQSSGDLRAVQEMLGHASISATQIYTHLDFQHLAKIYDSAHPRAKNK
ncbi:MAG: tyrosine recombinase XerC [Sulfuritalea sp.]|nr:tyrosine recombinase XerC [Sulfuritalea sp.]MBK9351858.1 tyrosine recombinase XerC [Sulfuritalea sp.]MBP7422034.1 tyrosine recombinase XerC [Sulfuritalea sp.]